MTTNIKHINTVVLHITRKYVENNCSVHMYFVFYIGNIRIVVFPGNKKIKLHGKYNEGCFQKQKNITI